MNQAIISVAVTLGVLCLGKRVRTRLKLPDTMLGNAVSGALIGAVAGVLAYMILSLF